MFKLFMFIMWGNKNLRAERTADLRAFAPIDWKIAKLPICGLHGNKAKFEMKIPFQYGELLKFVLPILTPFLNRDFILVVGC